MATPTIGIDASGDSFTAAIRNQEAPPVPAATFDNNQDGFDALDDWLVSHAVGAHVGVYVENTGVYSEALCYALHAKGYPVFVVEPVKVWKAMSGAAKTDPLDAARIAEYGCRYSDQLTAWVPREECVEEIRSLLTTREQLIQQRTASKNARKSLDCKVVKSSVAVDALQRAIDATSEQIKALEAEIDRLIQSEPRLKVNVALLCSIPSLKLLFASEMLVLTNGFTAVPNARSLAQYIGVAPNPYQSGSTILRRPRSRGCGPAVMRKLLHLAARTAVAHSPTHRRYYLRKVDQGKAKMLVLNNVANKLLRTACAVLRDQQPYHAKYRSYNPALFA